MRKINEAENRLVKSLRAGNEAALGEIIERYTAYAATIVWNIVSGRLCEADAKEIISDTFYTLWKNREKLRSGKLKSYLGIIARSRALDALRRAKQEICLDDIIGLSIAGPEEDVERAEEYLFLRKALESLPEPDYTIFVRYYYFYQKTGEIAEKMGLNVNTVQSKLSRGRGAIRKVLEKGGYYVEK